MANILKIKLGMVASSITVLILIPLLKSNFNAPVTITKWSELSWDNFKGFVPPFTGWGAAISSDVYIEYDSLTSKYIAYAGQNDQQSWVKSSNIESDYGLNHEQYHFNLTEFHARLMNSFIAQNDSINGESIFARLNSIRTELSIMQDEYDDESDHSLYISMQRRWEYKIDSLLKIYSCESGPVIDHYSGGQIFFPAEPTFYSGRNDYGDVYRIYQLEKYDMILALSSFQYEDFDRNSFRDDLVAYYESDSIKIETFNYDTLNSGLITSVVIAKDTAQGRAYQHIWKYNDNYVFKLTARYPTNKTDSIGYKEIANSFLSSFKISDTNDYWISRFNESKATIINTKIDRTDVNDEDDDSSTFCATYGEQKQYGFYRGPFYRDDGGLMLIYDVVETQDSTIYRNLLLYEDELYSYTPDSVDQIFYVPPDRLPQSPYKIDFGYLLKEDSVERCFEFFYQSIAINLEENES